MAHVSCVITSEIEARQATRLPGLDANASEMGLVLEVLAEPSPELVQGHPAPVPVVEELVLQPPVEALGCVPNVVARSPERGCGDRLCDDLPKARAENGFLDRCLMRLRGLDRC